MSSLEVLVQLTNIKIARPDNVTQVQTQNFTIVCKFIFNRLPLHLKKQIRVINCHDKKNVGIKKFD